MSLAALLAPDWVEERGCVMRADAYEPENFETWWRKTDGDRRAVEAVINHVHMYDVIEDTSDSDLRVLAEAVARCWRESLALTFPGREFTVEVVEDYGPTIVAYTTP
jgi:hypothetical protein